MRLSDSINTLPKVGPSVAKKLERLEIFTLKDLLYHFPFRYEDSSNAYKISDLVNYVGQVVTIKGKILAIDTFRTRYGKVLVNAKIYDRTGNIDVMWFNQSYITQYLKKDTEAIFYGKLTAKGKKKVQLMSPKYEVVGDYGTKFLGKISGIYPETSGMTSKWLKEKIIFILSRLVDINDKSSEAEWVRGEHDGGIQIEDTLDSKIRDKYDLVDLITALKYIHIPNNFEEIDKGKERLAFDEILEIQKQVLKSKQLRMQYKSTYIPTQDGLLETFIKNTPFTPTNAQIRSVEEIISDMAKDTPMNRLLEGDVGSGKTWVAAAATLHSLSEGHDVAFLAPTSVLANQHSASLLKILEPYNVNVELFTAGTKKIRVGTTLAVTRGQAQIFEGKKSAATLYVGTHALLHDKNIISNLGLVIVDEQHRFGVKQRELLLELEDEEVKVGIKNTPHFLSMTATPIPRSMALTVFGDLDLSILDELPQGRVEIETYLVNEDKRSSCYDWAKTQLRMKNEELKNSEKNQMFVICPLIDESDTLQAKSALSEFERVREEFSDFKVEILHGRMKEKEKNDILERFSRKEFDILVATPVIEVGIDIKDATIIRIESAERFGLAQLHQLRGRVGRSNKKSYCTLFSTSDSFPDRLKFFAQTTEGLKLAEFDLSQRGPGEVYGTKQSGIPKLKIANIMDTDLVKKVREAVEMM